jgi:hypothetical protein
MGSVENNIGLWAAAPTSLLFYTSGIIFLECSRREKRIEIEMEIERKNLG